MRVETHGKEKMMKTNNTKLYCSICERYVSACEVEVYENIISEKIMFGHLGNHSLTIVVDDERVELLEEMLQHCDKTENEGGRILVRLFQEVDDA